MSSQPENGWHGGSGSGDGQAPPAGNAAGDAASPNPTESIQGAEGVLPATAPTQRTPGAMGPLHGALLLLPLAFSLPFSFSCSLSF